AAAWACAGTGSGPGGARSRAPPRWAPPGSRRARPPRCRPLTETGGPGRPARQDVLVEVRDDGVGPSAGRASPAAWRTCAAGRTTRRAHGVRPRARRPGHPGALAGAHRGPAGTEGLRAGPTSPGLPAPDRPEGPGTPTGSASRRARQLPSLVAKTAACVRLSKPSLDSMLET